MQDVQAMLRNMARIGVVTDVDNDKHLCRVMYPHMDGMVSGWLYVLDSRPFIPDYDVPQRTEYEAGGSLYAEFASHKHDLIINQWMPKVNDRVFVFYPPVDRGGRMEFADGFVIGRIA